MTKCCERSVERFQVIFAVFIEAVRWLLLLLDTDDFIFTSVIYAFFVKKICV